MTDTMGKRISTLRKRAGLTQEQLADRLGVTPQAVSKWENDQCCPDMSILPELANVLGVSCDVLLGKEPMDSVTNSDGGTVKEKGLKFSAMMGKIVFPIMVIIFGVELLLRMIFKLDISIWTLLWTDAVMCTGIGMLVHRVSPFSVGVTCVGLYFMLNAFGVIPYIPSWEIVLIAVLLLWGISMLIDALTGKKHGFKFSGDVNTDGEHKKERFESNTDNGYIYYTASFCSKTAQAWEDTLRGGNISLSFGELTVDLTGCENVEEGACIDASASFGELIIILPKSVRAKVSDSAAFADIKRVGEPNPDATQELLLNCHASFGEIRVEYR